MNLFILTRQQYPAMAGPACKICTQLVYYAQHLHQQMHNLCALHHCTLLVQSDLQCPSIALCTPLWRCTTQLQAS